MKVLGLDISSSTIGYAVLSCNDSFKEIKLESVNFLKPLKKGTILERLADTRDKIKKIIETIKPDYIAIEDIVLFIRNKSTAQTITTLAVFNRMVGLVAQDFLKKSPTLINVLTIRYCIKKQANLNKFPEKTELPESLEKLLNINFPWIYNRNDKIKDESYDMSDAICCAYCYVMLLQEAHHEIKKEPIKKRKKKSKK